MCVFSYAMGVAVAIHMTILPLPLLIRHLSTYHGTFKVLRFDFCRTIPKKINFATDATAQESFATKATPRITYS